MESVNAELALVSQEAYMVKDESKLAREEISNLENQLRIVDKDQASLRATLAKLKAKQETHRARAVGAVCHVVAWSINALSIRRPSSPKQSEGSPQIIRVSRKECRRYE